MLDVQVNMYSVDTGHFYSCRERYLHYMNCKYRMERNYLNNKISDLVKQLIEKFGYDKDKKTKMKHGNFKDINIIEGSEDIVESVIFYSDKVAYKRKKAYESKKKLLNIISKRVNDNIAIDEKNKADGKNRKINIRKLRENDLRDTNIISVFNSALTRAIGIKQDELSEDLIVVQVYYFDVFKDMSYFGFEFHGEKYRYLTSSAGQIRKKKAVFIKESTWARIEKTIMCGLTVDRINEKGGNNVNKHLAYLALSNSATDPWYEFDIDKSIVIDDFETNVLGTFDLVDEVDYTVTRKSDYVPVPHTDGSGMMLPCVSEKNFMFRAPWVKGLLGVFDFKRFIEVNNYSSIIQDIYGKEYDIVKDDIQIIFTKSQFKMYKYYDSWDEYKKHFKEHGCVAGICNVEEERIKNTKINYQMLQTLTNVTEEEIDSLTQKSYERIQNVCTSKDTMLDILGATPYNTHLTPFQKAIKIYPQLLTDTYSKDVLREVKNSLLKKYRSGKLEVNGKYTFLLPDFYAACEYWFGHIKNPKGLLKDKEVFCWLYNRYDKLDCLRSPHLYKEHAVRFNVASKSYTKRSEDIREWFTTNAVYTSTHDLISKILQFDVDGDKSLVVADPEFVSIAERNMNGIVPLYYNMKKAAPTLLNNKTIYDGLNKAFTSGNIGVYSNDISKIWNHEVFISGTDQEKEDAITLVKILCMENNFCIDSAKTLYMPTRVEGFQEKISYYTKNKLPAFFEFAKDKQLDQVCKRNNSFVNKIYERIPDKAINTRSLKLGQIDYKKMMKDNRIVCARDVIELHDELNKQYRYMINMKDEHIDNLRYVACSLREKFRETGYSDEMLCDMLVEYLYKNNKRYKQLLWFCYGKNIVHNLESNLGVRATKVIQCVDCDEWFEIDVKDTKTTRCPKCYSIYRKKYKALKEQERRQRLKNVDRTDI